MPTVTTERSRVPGAMRGESARALGRAEPSEVRCTEAPRRTQVQPAEALVGVLTEALRELGEVGAPERASRLAGRAWSALRDEHPTLARRLNALMHGLAKMPSDPAHDDQPPPQERSTRNV